MHSEWVIGHLRRMVADIQYRWWRQLLLPDKLQYVLCIESEPPLLNDQPQTNPYESPIEESNSLDHGRSGCQRFLLVMLVIVLLARGGFMIFGWGLKLFSGIDLSSHFLSAMFLKDATYAVTALIGGLLLIFKRPLGWWCSTIHWFWYIGCEVFVVLTAESLSWQFPVRFDPPQLFTSVTKRLGLAVVALAILFWKPTIARCNVGRRRRTAMVSSLLVGCIAIAFLVNWWSTQ